MNGAFTDTKYVRIVPRTPETSRSAAEYPFRHSIRVRFAETDAMGIVHHGRYLPYLEETRVEFLRSIGHPYSDERSDGVDYAVLEARIRYLQPLRFDEVVVVHLRIAAATRATFSIDYLLAVGDRITTTATTVHGCVDRSGRPVRLPRWLGELVSPLR